MDGITDLLGGICERLERLLDSLDGAQFDDVKDLFEECETMVAYVAMRWGTRGTTW